MKNNAAEFFGSVAAALDELEKHPYGIPSSGPVHKLAGDALTKLCDGNPDQARSMWKQIVADLGYMPHCVAYTLVLVSQTENVVPDVEAPIL